jgi:hypothetical protein
MFTNLSGLEAALIGLAVALLFIVRQFSTRRVMSPWMVLVPLALALFGISNGFGQLNSTAWMLLGLNLSLGVVLGVMRAMSFRLWTNERGEALIRGTRVTLLLWLATLAVKVGLSVVEQRTGLGSFSSGAELLIPVAATLAAQNLGVFLRSQDVRLVTA